MQGTAKTLMILVLIVVGAIVVYSIGGETIVNLKAKFDARSAENSEEKEKEDEQKQARRSQLVSSRTNTREDATSTTKEIVKKDDQSEFYGLIDVQAGSAKQKDPQKEYISLSNRSKDKHIEITGWTLKNGKDQKLFQIGGGGTVKGTSDVVIIPTAVKNVQANAAFNAETTVVLKPLEKAVILTGLFPKNPILNTSFKTNMCIGYLLPTNPVYPSLARSCPAPELFGEYSHFESSCYTYIDKIALCETPKIDEGQALLSLTPQCRDFIRERYNYNGCLRSFQYSEKFEGKEWRIYLNRSSELWAETRETITLFDSKGKIVDTLAY